MASRTVLSAEAASFASDPSVRRSPQPSQKVLWEPLDHLFTVGLAVCSVRLLRFPLQLYLLLSDDLDSSGPGTADVSWLVRVNSEPDVQERETSSETKGYLGLGYGSKQQVVEGSSE